MLAPNSIGLKGKEIEIEKYSYIDRYIQYKDNRKEQDPHIRYTWTKERPKNN